MRKSEVRSRRSEIGGIVFFLIAVLCPLTSLFAQATYVPRAIKELDDARGVSLSLKFAPIWDGTKFTPRFILQSDVTDLVSDLSGKVPVSRTVNGHPLSSDVTIAYGDLDGPFPTFPASMGATASNFFTSYNSASGLFTKAQPAFSDLSGTPTTLAGYGITDGVASSRTVNGHPLSANVTVAYSELGGPFPTFPANTGATANQFFTAYADTTGLFTKAQPSIANLSDAGTLATWAGITPGTGVGTALAINVGTSGAFVTKDGALGTPASGTLTNATGLPPAGVTGTAAILGSNTFTGAQANSYTSTASTPAMYYTGTWLTGGTGTTNFPHLLLQATGTTASTAWSTAGTAIGANAVTGFTGNLIDLQVAGTSKFKVSSSGSLTLGSSISTGGGMTVAGAVTLTSGYLVVPAAGQYYFSGRSTIFSPADGRLLLQNYANNNFDRLQFGGTTSSFPALKRNSTALNVRLADDSADAPITASNMTASGTLAVTGVSTLTGGLIGGVQALSGSGAVNLTTLSTAFTSTGAANALTLANGTEGQRKSICHVAKGTLGTGILTPTTANGYTTITFTSAGDSVELEYHATGGWCIIGSHGVTIT